MILSQGTMDVDFVRKVEALSGTSVRRCFQCGKCSAGGHMAQLSETFPTLDCSQCIMTPKMVDVANHPKIKLYTYSEIEKVDGYIGNFQVTIKKKARSVDEDKCTGCGPGAVDF